MLFFACANSEKIYSYPMYLESIITTGEVHIDLRKDYGTIAVDVRSYKKL